MSPKQAPIVAAWMVQHLVPGDSNEALEGDLLEELGSGRSSSWYRRQVFGILAVAWRREIVDHRAAFLFATPWSMLAPVWMELAHTKHFLDLVAPVQQLDWPWSAICPVPLRLSLLLVFLWTGVLLFFCCTRSRTKHSNLRPFRQGFARGTLILMPVWLATVALCALLSPNSARPTFFVCVPFFIATLCAIWGVSRECNVRQRPLPERPPHPASASSSGRAGASLIPTTRENARRADAP